MASRRLAAGAVGVAVLLAGPDPGTAAERAAKGPPDPEDQLEFVAKSLLLFVRGGWGDLGRDFREDVAAIELPVLDPPEPTADPLEDILEELAETESLWGDLLRETGTDWRDEIEEIRKADAALAAEASAAGSGAEADDLYAAEVLATQKLRFSLGKSLGPVRKELVASGRPVSIVGPLTRDPQHPVLFVERGIPFYFPLLACVGQCDGRASVVALDPSWGQDAGVETSFLQFVGPNSPDVAAELTMTRGADFPEAEKPVIFQVAGLAPGDYVLRAGALEGGLHVVTGSLVFTIPSWDPANPPPPPDRHLARDAKELGLTIQRFVRADGARFVREMKSVAKDVKEGGLTPEEGFVAGTEAIADLERLFRERRLAGIVEYQGLLADLAVTDPAAADRESSAGTGSSADVLDSYLRGAETLLDGSAFKGATLLRKACLKAGAPFSIAPRGAPRTPHPLAEATPAFRSARDEMQVFARCDGTLRVLAIDPRDFDEIDAAAIQVRDGTGATIVERELLDADFDDEDVGLVDLAGLSPGRTYSVRLVTSDDLPLVVLDEAIVTVPAWGDGGEPPPPACTVTSFTATINGAPFAVPPFDALRVQITDGKFYGMSLRYADPTSSIVPQFNFLMSPHEFVDVTDLTDAETVVTKPPTSSEAISYFFFPSQIKFTSEVSATYRIRNLRSFVVSGGCASVEIDGVYAEWQGMTQVPYSLRLTMSAADVTQ